MWAWVCLALLAVDAEVRVVLMEVEAEVEGSWSNVCGRWVDELGGVAAAVV